MRQQRPAGVLVRVENADLLAKLFADDPDGLQKIGIIRYNDRHVETSHMRIIKQMGRKIDIRPREQSFSMIRVITDFQAIDSKGSLFVLRVDNENLEQQALKLAIQSGDKVILDAYEDFEVVGNLEFRFVDVLEKEAWVANPDWSTRTDKVI